MSADYRSVEFGVPSIIFSGEGRLSGNNLELSGNGELELSGAGDVSIVGHGVITVVIKGDTKFTIVNKIKQSESLSVNFLGHIENICRLNIVVELGAHALYEERVALKVSGRLDVATTVTHGRASESKLRTRLVLEDGAKAIARGAIVIGEQAGGSRASERLDALLLGARAEADLLPTLSVANDDVTCNHAATVGHADPAVLYYLQSRGLAAVESKKLLTDGFLAG